MHWSGEVLGHAIALSSPLAACYAARLLTGLAEQLNESGYGAHPNPSSREHDTESNVAVGPATPEKSEDDIFQYHNAVFCRKEASKRMSENSDATECDDDDTDFCIMTPQQALGALGDHATKFTKIFLNGVTFVSDASEGTVLSVDEYLDRVQPALSRPRSTAGSSESRSSCRSPMSRYNHHAMKRPFRPHTDGGASPLAVSCYSMELSTSSMATSDISVLASTARNSFESACQSSSSSPSCNSQDPLFAAGISTEGSCYCTTPQVNRRDSCSPCLAYTPHEQLLLGDESLSANDLCPSRSSPFEYACTPISLPCNASDGGVPPFARGCCRCGGYEGHLQQQDVAAMLAMEDICSPAQEDEDGDANGRTLLAKDSVFPGCASSSGGDMESGRCRQQSLSHSPCRLGHQSLRDCGRPKRQFVPGGNPTAPAAASVQLRRTTLASTPASSSEPKVQATATLLTRAQSASVRVCTARPSVSGVLDASADTSSTRKRDVCPGTRALPRHHSASVGGVTTPLPMATTPNGLSKAPALPLPDGCSLESSVPPALRYYLAQARAAGSQDGSQGSGSSANSEAGSGGDVCEKVARRAAERRQSTDYASPYQPGFVRATVEQLNTQRLVCCHVTPYAAAKTSNKPRPLTAQRVATAK